MRFIFYQPSYSTLSINNVAKLFHEDFILREDKINILAAS